MELCLLLFVTLYIPVLVIKTFRTLSFLIWALVIKENNTKHKNNQKCFIKLENLYYNNIIIEEILHLTHNGLRYRLTYIC